ncbi:DMT family transporter [Sinorhizobium alkalisoli]|uniref:DMT family transporter n=1 Tax=Sinorhizobium alkalisoli TaxID=1752398 RepID=UPI00124E6810|nr:DMT family transporter [Sinorhizobium alkalisoli]QFI67079.1 Membrane protein [Sinorhizobium alkalisoli]
MSDVVLSRSAPDRRVSYGLMLMVLSVLISPVIDVFAKLAIATVPSAEITAVRFLLQVVFILPVVLYRRTMLDLTWKKSALHALRGGLLVLTMLSFITTLKVMEVADAIAIFFVEPIILTILGSIFLKETIGWRRYTACAVGFFGAMLVIQPSMQEVGPIALLPIVAAFTLAVFLLLTRMVAQNEDPWSMQFHAGIWGCLFCLVLLAFGQGTGSSIVDPVWPEGRVWLYLWGVGVAATVSGVLGVYAYRAAPASVLAPLQYLEIVSATILGWLVFGDLPDALKWLGIAIIIGSGLYIIWRERRLQKTAGTPPVSPAI